jgi:cytochrome c oxidase subunit IV
VAVQVDIIVHLVPVDLVVVVLLPLVWGILHLIQDKQEIPPVLLLKMVAVAVALAEQVKMEVPLMVVDMVD